MPERDDSFDGAIVGPIPDVRLRRVTAPERNTEPEPPYPVGDLVLRRHGDGRVEVVEAPERVLISLELLHGSCSCTFSVCDDVIALAGQVAYRVVGWEATVRALIAERLDGPASPVGGGGR